jgi:hypothetical protein
MTGNLFVVLFFIAQPVKTARDFEIEGQGNSVRGKPFRK